MATDGQVQHYQTLAAQAAAMRGDDDAVTVGDWRINATASGFDVWFHISAGCMHGGTFMSARQARKLAALLIAAADGEGGQ